MKLIIATTQTSHHAFFVQEIIKAYPVNLVLVEQRKLIPTFSVKHPFEVQRDAYENKVFFGGQERHIEEIAPVVAIDSMNGADALATIDRIAPDVIISFGTGKISKDVIRKCPASIINLHGGNPEEYRGLDSHLWAIYHKDFQQLITTLHHLNEFLDDGEIILQASVPLRRDMKIYELRRFNTEVCLKLTLRALAVYQKNGAFTARPQQKQGRYYSFMPAPLKEICQEYFERYTSTL